MILGSDRLNLEQLRWMCENRVLESGQLDFKRAVPSGDHRFEIAKDVAALANSHGGRLIYGVSAPGGQAKDLHPILTSSADGLLRTIADVITSQVSPRVIFDHYAVPVAADECVLVVDVAPSWTGPHGAVRQKRVEFWERIPMQNREMSYEQIATAFRMRTEIPERIREDQSARITDILTSSAYSSISGFPTVHLLVQPLAAYTGHATVSMRDAYDRVLSLAPRNAQGGWSLSYDLEGVLALRFSRGTSGSIYCRIRRDGVAEVIDATLGSGKYSGARSRWMSPAYEKRFVEVADAAVAALSDLQVYGPLLVSVGLLNWGGARLAFHSDSVWSDSQSLPSEVVRLPAVEIQDRSATCAAALRPAFDVLWNGFGQERALCYDEQGAPLW